jgi:hypothetical protein
VKSSAIYTPNARIRGYLQGSENGRVVTIAFWKSVYEVLKEYIHILWPLLFLRYNTVTIGPTSDFIRAFSSVKSLSNFFSVFFKEIWPCTYGFQENKSDQKGTNTVSDTSMRYFQLSFFLRKTYPVWSMPTCSLVLNVSKILGGQDRVKIQYFEYLF